MTLWHSSRFFQSTLHSRSFSIQTVLAASSATDIVEGWLVSWQLARQKGLGI